MDSATFRQIVTTHREGVFATIARITGQPNAVESLALDVFAAAYRSRNQFESWNICLTRLAVQLSLKHLRAVRPAKDRLAALSPEQRAAFVLQYAENRAQDEVCAILRISEPALRKLLRRAHHRLTEVEPAHGGWLFLKMASGWRR